MLDLHKVDLLVVNNVFGLHHYVGAFDKNSHV